VLDTCVFSVSS